MPLVLHQIEMQDISTDQLPSTLQQEDINAIDSIETLPYTQSVETSSPDDQRMKNRQQKYQLSMEAKAIIDSKKTVKEVCRKYMENAPEYKFKKCHSKDHDKPPGQNDDKPNDRLSKFYLCQMTIKTKGFKKYNKLMGVFHGTGQSKRIAKLAACKNALQYWGEEKLIMVDGQIYSQYIREEFKKLANY